MITVQWYQLNVVYPNTIYSNVSVIQIIYIFLLSLTKETHLAEVKHPNVSVPIFLSKT